MKKLISLGLIGFMMLFSGCIATNENNEVIGLKGIISGATYKPSILVHVYEVATFTTKTLMTKEQIENVGLDKADAIIRYAYSYVTDEDGKIIEGKTVEVEELKDTTLNTDSTKEIEISQ